MKIQAVRFSLIHQVQKILIARNDQLCICRNRQIDVMSIIGITRVSECFGEWGGPKAGFGRGTVNDTISPMVLRLKITPEAEARLRARAKDIGVDLETFATRQLEAIAATPRSLKEISGPIGEAFEASGMSEEELADFIDKEIHAMRAERRAKRKE